MGFTVVKSPTVRGYFGYFFATTVVKSPTYSSQNDYREKLAFGGVWSMFHGLGLQRMKSFVGLLPGEPSSLFVSR